MGCAKSTVHSYLWEMDRRGLRSYDGRTAETPVTRKADAGFVLSPVLGSISCGELEYAEENLRSMSRCLRRSSGKAISSFSGQADIP